MQILTLDQVWQEEKILKNYSQNPPGGVVFAQCDFAWHFSQYSPALCMFQEDTQSSFWILLNPPGSNKTSDRQRLKLLKTLSPNDHCCVVISRESGGCLRLEHIKIVTDNRLPPEA